MYNNYIIANLSTIHKVSLTNKILSNWGGIFVLPKMSLDKYFVIPDKGFKKIICPNQSFHCPTR